MPRPWLFAAFWLVAVVTATGTGLIAVSLAVPDLRGDDHIAPLSSAEVAHALAAGPAPGQAGPVPVGLPNASGRLFTFPAGTVIATCTDGRAILQSWSPAAGWEVDDVRRGPLAVAELEFDGTGERDDLKVRIWCRDGRPEAESHDD